MKFEKLPYKNLNARRKENYNYAKIAARLADYGYSCMRLSDDWEGADFIAFHVDGETSIKVQLKSRLTVDKKYCEKDIHIAFIDRAKDGDDIYIFPHDDFVIHFESSKLEPTESWKTGGQVHWKSPSGWAKNWLEDKGYKI